MDIELAIDMLEMAQHIDHAILFSGDGDFRRLVEAVQRRGVRVSVVSTIRSSPPMVVRTICAARPTASSSCRIWRRASCATIILATRFRALARRSRSRRRERVWRSPSGTLTDPRDCPLCPRLAAFREAQRLTHPDWFNAPVPSFGDDCGGAADRRPRARPARRQPDRPPVHRRSLPAICSTARLLKFGYAAGDYARASGGRA